MEYYEQTIFRKNFNSELTQFAIPFTLDQRNLPNMKTWRTNPVSEEESRKTIQERHRKNPTMKKKDKVETIEKSSFRRPVF